MKRNTDNLDEDFDTAQGIIWNKLPTRTAVVSWLAVLFLFVQILFLFGQGDEIYSFNFLGNHKVQSTTSFISGDFGCSQSAASLTLNQCHTTKVQEVITDSRYVLRSDMEPSVYCSELSAANQSLRAGDYNEKDLLCDAHKAAMVPIAGKPKVAFLFLVRGDIIFETLWRRFFHGHEESYSVYVHASNASYEYPESSFFHRKNHVPSRPVERFSMTLVDAQRRLLAHALLDARNANAWFTFVCESTLPVRNFPFAFNYLMNSEASFVEAFQPKFAILKQWKQEPELLRNQTRKGEAWMSLHRRHAGLIVGEATLYGKFDRDLVGAAHDESYIQTLLAIADAQGIANRTVMYVDWSDPHHSSHPRLIEVRNLTQGAATFKKIQQQTRNEDGYFNDSRDRAAMANEPSCIYNGSPFSGCYIFARKFAAGAEEVEALLSLPKEVLGY